MIRTLYLAHFMFDSVQYYVKRVFQTALAEKGDDDAVADHYGVRGVQLRDSV